MKCNNRDEVNKIQVLKAESFGFYFFLQFDVSKDFR